MHTRLTKIPAIPALSAVMNAWRHAALFPGGNAGRGAPRAPAGDGSAAHLVAGVLAHLARHMEGGCPLAAGRAAILLARIADDPCADPALRLHAGALAEILERDDAAARSAAPRAAVHAWKGGFASLI